jgi:hypothetical protein
MGSAAPAFVYVRVSYPQIRDLEAGTVEMVDVDAGVCFVHARAKTENNPNGILDPMYGVWVNPFNGLEIKEPGGGGKPVKDGYYRLVNDNVKYLTGQTSKGRLPNAPTAPRVSKDAIRFETKLVLADQEKVAATIVKTEGLKPQVPWSKRK